MASVSLAFDARGAQEGERQFSASAQKIRREAAEVVASITKINDAMRRIGGENTGGAQIIALGKVARSYDETAQAARRAREVERALEADRLRAAREQSRADAARLREREQATTRLRSLESRLGDKFPEERAISQRIIAERDLARAVRAGLVDEQRAFTLRQKIAENFTTQAVAARSLRANVATLAGEMGNLASSSSAALGPLLSLASTVRRIAVSVGATGAVGGGSVNPSESGGGGGGAVIAVGGLGRAFTALGTASAAAVAGVAAVAGGAILLAPSIGRASIEMDKIEGQLRAATGSAAGAREEFRFIREESDRLGLALGESASGYARVAAAARGTKLEGEGVRDIFTGIATASSALRLSAAETSGVLFAVEQIISKNRLSSEELRRQLGDRLPGAFTLAAEAMGVTTAELDKMLQLGKITADEFLIPFARLLVEKYGGESVQAAKGLTASFEKLKNESKLLLDTIGERTGIIDAFVGSLTRGAALLKSINEALDSTPFDRFERSVPGAEKRLNDQRAREDAAKKLGSLNLGASIDIAFSDDERKALGIPTDEEIAKIAKAGREALLSVDRVRAAEDKRRETVESLQKALDIGKLTQAEYNDGVRLADAELRRAMESTEGHAKAVGRQARAVKEAADTFPAYLQSLRNEVALSSLANDQREQAEALLRAQTEARRELTEEEKRAVVDAVTARSKNDAAAKAVPVEEIRTEAERGASVLEEPLRRAFESIQDAGADAFRTLFGGAERDGQSFADRLVDTMREAAAQIAALLVFRPLISGVSGIAAGGIPSLGGLLGSGLPAASGGGTAAGGAGFLGGIANIGRSLLGGLNTSVLGSNTLLGGLLDQGVLRGIVSPGLGNAVLGATTPLAGLGGLGGGLLANALGLGNQNSLISGAFGTAGSLLGGIGGTLLLGPVGGVLGSAAGAFLGTALSGLVGSNHSGRSRVVFNGLGLNPDSRVNFEGSGDQAFRDAVATSFSSIDEAIGAFGNADEIRRRLRGMVTNVSTFRADERGALEGALTTAYGGTFNEIFRNLEGINSSAPGNRLFASAGGGPQAVLATGLQILSEVADFNEAVDALTGPKLSDAAQSLKGINAEFDALKKSGEALGATSERLAEIEAGRTKAIEALRTGFADETRLAILAIEDPLQYIIETERKAAEERLENARDLGADLSQTQKLNDLLLKQALDDFYASAYQGIDDFIRRQTATTASPLSNATALANAQSLFDTTLSGALAGNSQALADFPTAADALIDLARAYYASGPGFVAIFDQVIAAAERLRNVGQNANLALVPDITGLSGRSFGSSALSFAGSSSTDRVVASILPVVRSGGSADSAGKIERAQERQTIELRAELRALREEFAQVRSQLAILSDAAQRQMAVA